jgi:hypothetical protein
MIRRPLRPHFSLDDQRRLIVALRDAREWVIKCSSAQPYGSERHRRCDEITRAIDGLAGDLVGDHRLFHGKPATSGPKDG